MRFFHLSDLHIGLRLYNRDLGVDQEHILQEIVRLAGEQSPDAVVIAGDIYDKSLPSQEAVALFDSFISSLSMTVPEAEILIISGNHDSGVRVNLFRNLLSRQHVHMIGLPPLHAEEHIEKITLSDEYGPVHFYLLPFVRPSMMRTLLGSREDGSALSYDETIRALLARETIDTSERNVLVSHQFYLPEGKKAEEVERMDSEIRIVGNIDEVSTAVLQPFDYAALGHIHKAMKAGNERYRYSGTPLACSLSEAGQEKGLILVELGEKGDVRTEVLYLTPLRQVREIKGTLDEVCARASKDYVRIVLTDKAETDVFEMQDRLRTAFPNLLEIRREGFETVNYDFSPEPEDALDPLDLMRSFLGEMSGEEEKLLKEVLVKVQEET